jgi:hypothetical protein
VNNSGTVTIDEQYDMLLYCTTCVSWYCCGTVVVVVTGVKGVLEVVVDQEPMASIVVVPSDKKLRLS